MTETMFLVKPRREDPPLRRLSARRLGRKNEVQDALQQQTKPAIWIAPDEYSTGLLVRSLDVRPNEEQRLLLLQRVDGRRLGILHAFFRTIVATEEGARLLPIDDLVEVLSSPARRDLFIGVAADPESQLVVLYRGDLEPLALPGIWFRVRPEGPHPDFTKVDVIDSGQTIRLGRYEASADAILYEFDREYRQRVKAREVQEDPSFGGALRRLRLQRGLGRGDFPGVSEKSIARIERGEVGKPHSRTLARIAAHLGVTPDEISTY